MHCQTLSSLDGIGKYTKLAELDSSSNQIEELTGLDKCVNMVNLNLSCNSIRVMAPTVLLKLVNLTSIDLSHNRISTLEVFQVVRASLDTLKLRDNLIADLDEVAYL